VKGLTPIRSRADPQTSKARHAERIVFENTFGSYMKIIFVVLSAVTLVRIFGVPSLTNLPAFVYNSWVLAGIAGGLIILTITVARSRAAAKVALPIAGAMVFLGLGNQAMAAHSAQAHFTAARYDYYLRVGEEAARESTDTQLRENIRTVFREIAEGRNPFQNQEQAAEDIVRNKLAQDEAVRALQKRVGVTAENDESVPVARTAARNVLMNWFGRSLYRNADAGIVKDVKVAGNQVRGELDTERAPRLIRAQLIMQLAEKINVQDSDYQATLKKIIDTAPQLKKFMQTQGLSFEQLAKLALPIYQKHIASVYMQDKPKVITPEKAGRAIAERVIVAALKDKIQVGNPELQQVADSVGQDNEEIKSLFARTGITSEEKQKAMLQATPVNFQGMNFGQEESAFIQFMAQAMLNNKKFDAQEARRDSAIRKVVIEAATKEIEATDEQFRDVLVGLYESYPLLSRFNSCEAKENAEEDVGVLGIFRAHLALAYQQGKPEMLQTENIRAAIAERIVGKMVEEGTSVDEPLCQQAGGVLAQDEKIKTLFTISGMSSADISQAMFTSSAVDYRGMSFNQSSAYVRFASRAVLENNENALTPENIAKDARIRQAGQKKGFREQRPLSGV
jgi:hypothetical protein